MCLRRCKEPFRNIPGSFGTIQESQAPYVQPFRNDQHQRQDHSEIPNIRHTTILYLLSLNVKPFRISRYETYNYVGILSPDV